MEKNTIQIRKRSRSKKDIDEIEQSIASKEVKTSVWNYQEEGFDDVVQYYCVVCLFVDSFHLHFDRKDDNLESRGSINYQFSRMYGGIDKYGGDIVCQKQKEEVDVQ